MRATVLAALCLTVLAFVAVQGEQWLLRWRAERLLADMRELQSHESKWPDAQKIMMRWRPWGLGESSCAPQECFFYVRMMDPIGAFVQENFDRHPSSHLLIWPLQLLGEKYTFIEASLRVSRGLVEESRFRMNFWGRNEGISIAVNDFGAWDYPSERWQHPDYYAEKHPGCDDCIRFETGFTPFAGSDKIRELTDFNFSCITRWSPCTTEADVMPTAWRLYQRELPRMDDMQRAFEKCQVPLEFFGQEDRSIAVADVLSRQGPKPSGNNNGSSASLRIVRGLKGHMPWPNNKTLDASSESQGEDVFWTGTPDLVAGKRYILFGDVADGSVGENVFWLDVCGAVPYDEQNLSEIQRGIDVSLARQLSEK